MTSSAADRAELKPSWSVAMALTLCAPWPSPTVMDHWPLPSAVPVPATLLPSYSVTVEPATAVPAKVCVAAWVMLSDADRPVSEAGASAGLPGAASSALVTTVIAFDRLDVLPAASVADAVMWCVPTHKARVYTVQVPALLTTALPSGVAPSYRVTVEPASPTPVICSLDTSV